MTVQNYRKLLQTHESNHVPTFHMYRHSFGPSYYWQHAHTYRRLSLVNLTVCSWRAQSNEIYMYRSVRSVGIVSCANEVKYGHWWKFFIWPNNLSADFNNHKCIVAFLWLILNSFNQYLYKCCLITGLNYSVLSIHRDYLVFGLSLLESTLQCNLAYYWLILHQGWSLIQFRTKNEQMLPYHWFTKQFLSIHIGIIVSIGICSANVIMSFIGWS